MAEWETFELNCTDFLNNTFGKYAHFYHEGGKNSTTPDIIVVTNHDKTFYMEVKHCPAQCGQFVLLPNDEEKKFEYSKKNITPINDSSTKIINFMNKSFDDFKSSGTKGKTIEIPNNTEIFSNWIMQSYLSKGVRYIITNNFTIIPVKNFALYFDITGTYRTKKSGSSKVGKKQISHILEYIENNFQIQSYHSEDGKLFVSSNINLNKEKFHTLNYDYMFTLKNNEYEVRKLSNTNNANVIFSITLKNNSPLGLTHKTFIKQLL